MRRASLPAASHWNSVPDRSQHDHRLVHTTPSHPENRRSPCPDSASCPSQPVRAGTAGGPANAASPCTITAQLLTPEGAPIAGAGVAFGDDEITSEDGLAQPVVRSDRDGVLRADLPRDATLRVLAGRAGGPRCGIGGPAAPAAGADRTGAAVPVRGRRLSLRAERARRLEGDGRSLTVNLPIGPCTVRLWSQAASLATRDGVYDITDFGVIEVGDAASQLFELPVAAPPPDATLR